MIEQLPEPVKDPAQAYVCDTCSAVFETAHGLHMYATKQHPTSVQRFIPSSFDRLRHAVDGLPKCAACGYSFKQWKGLRDHLLSGACPNPDRLKQPSDEDACSSAPETIQLAGPRTEVLGLPQHQLGSQACKPAAALLNHRCLVCNFCTPDRTKVKSHFRQAHPGDWARLHPATAKLCQTYSIHTMKGQMCPFCQFKVHDRRQHPEQCSVLYQVVSYWLRSRADLHQIQAGHSPPPPETQSLHRFFGTRRPAATTSSSQPTVTVPADTSGSTRRCCTLSKTSNSCYANSVLLAMLALCWEQYDLGVFGSLMRVLSSDSRKPLNLFGLFEFRHLTAGWRLDGRQHDAAEFLTHLLNQPSGSLAPSQWQSTASCPRSLVFSASSALYSSDFGTRPRCTKPSKPMTILRLWRPQLKPFTTKHAGRVDL